MVVVEIGRLRWGTGGRGKAFMVEYGRFNGKGVGKSIAHHDLGGQSHSLFFSMIPQHINPFFTCIGNVCADTSIYTREV